MPTPAEIRTQFAKRMPLGVCLTATLAGVWLRFVYLTHAGGLWRDETSGVQLATLPAFSETWRMLAHDSFPVFFFALVRAWTALGLGANDFTLRLLGGLIGLGVLGAMWLNARLMGFRLPYISLALLAANLTLVSWGDSLRAYGCGSGFILLTLGLVWKLTQAPGRANFFFAALAAILSVQTLFQNIFLVAAASGAGAILCARNRQWKTTGWVLGVALLAGASQVPYVPLIIESQKWWLLQKTGFDFDRAVNDLTLATGSLAVWPLLGWLVLTAITLAAGWSARKTPARDARISSEDRPFFAALALGLGIAGFFLFLRLAALPTEPWYFLPLMVFAAAMDAALASRLRRLRLWPAVLMAVMVGLLFPATWKFARYRQTNIDLLAIELNKQAQPGDLIVVTLWSCGVTFARYYTGPAEWTTLPPLEDHRFHRMDLIEKSFEAKPALKRVLDQVAQTLASGHAVWLVGSLPEPRPGEIKPPELPKLPPGDHAFDYQDGIFYGYVWERQVEYLITTRAKSMEIVPVHPETRINPYEKLSLFKALGRRPDEQSQR